MSGSDGSLIGTLVALALLGGEVRAAPPPKLGPLMRPVGKAVVDWEEGVAFARGAAAADLRLPGVDAPRAGAVRAAKGKAARDLKLALAKIPLGKGRKRQPAVLEAALDRGQVLDPEYQTNGGVVLALGVQLAHLVESPPARKEPPPLVLAVASMPFEVAPTVVVKGKPYPLASAVYRLGRPPKDAGAVTAKRDGKGRLVLAKPPADLTAEGARAVIYVRSAKK